MVQIDITRIAEEEQKAPEFQQELAEFQKRCDALEKDPREKFRLCVHEAGHMVYFRRLGWTIKKLRGPYMYRDVEVKLRKILGAVLLVRGEANDFIAAVKSDIGSFVLVEAITGEPESEAAINGDMRVLTSIEAPKEAIEAATEEILSELSNDGFTFELIGAVREYEYAVFGTDETWVWGWNEYRLDLPGQRYAVGPGWLLIEHENQLKFIVRGGKELLPNDENLQYMDVSPVRCGERAADAVRRWKAMIPTTGVATRHLSRV